MNIYNYLLYHIVIIKNKDYTNGGEIEIRTLAGLASPNGFQDHPLQPLGYFSKKMVDPAGLEPATTRL